MDRNEKIFLWICVLISILCSLNIVLAECTYLANTSNIAYYSFNTNCTGNDALTSLYTLTNNGVVNVASGKLGNGCDFEIDDANDYLIATISNTAENAFSIAGWYKLESSNAYQMVAGFDDSPTNGKITGSDYRLDIDDNRFIVYGASSNSVVSTIDFTDSNYHFFCMGVDASGRIKRSFFDGVDYGESNTLVDLDTLDRFIIGNVWNDAQPFDGLIDEIQLYNYVLTEQDCLNLYNSGNACNPYSSISDTTFPIFSFISQNPTIINQSNLIGRGLNITYNISDNIGMNNGSIYINVSVENLGENITYYFNGTAIRSKQQYTYTTVNVSNYYIFSLDENQVYQGTYNHNESLMETTQKKYYDCNLSTCSFQIEVYNFTNKSVNIVEIGLKQSSYTLPLGNMQIGVCNAPNILNPLDNTTNCTLVFQNNYFPENHSHRGGLSNHSIFTFTFNTSNRRVNNIYLPNVVYFYLISNNNYPSNRFWSFAYIDGTYRTNSLMYNSGTTLTNLNLSFDFHIHQIQPNQTKIFYQVCGKDTSNNFNCSSEVQTTIVTDYMNPDTPIFTNPNISQVFNNPASIYISWLRGVSPMGTSISNYTLYIGNFTNKTTLTTTTNTLYYVYTPTENKTNTNFILRICDNLGYCSFGESQNISILFFTVPPSDTVILLGINQSLANIDVTTNNIWGEIKMLGIIVINIIFILVILYLTKELNKNIIFMALMPIANITINFIQLLEYDSYFTYFNLDLFQVFNTLLLIVMLFILGSLMIIFPKKETQVQERGIYSDINYLNK